MQPENSSQNSTWRRRLRALVVVEVVVCFSPLLAILTIGVAMLPLQVRLLFHENTLPFLGLVLGGLAGVTGVSRLLIDYLRSGSTNFRRSTTLVCILSGFLAFGYYAYDSMAGSSISIVELAIFGLPLLCASHVLYVTRSYWSDPR
jgi:hypothetical protein